MCRPPKKKNSHITDQENQLVINGAIGVPDDDDDDQEVFLHKNDTTSTSSTCCSLLLVQFTVNNRT
jgi:hypothetical protein